MGIRTALLDFMKTAFDIQQLENERFCRTKKKLLHNHTFTNTTCTSCKIFVLWKPSHKGTKNDLHRMVLFVCQSGLHWACGIVWEGGVSRPSWKHLRLFTRHPADCRCGWPDLSSCPTGFYPSQCRLPSSPCPPPAARPPDRNGTPALSAGRPASVSLPPTNRQTTIRKQRIQ